MELGSNLNVNQSAKLRWGELEEDDGEDLDFLFPPKQVIGPDENGIKKVIEHKFNEEKKVKIATVTRTRKLANARLSKRAVERRSSSNFGDAVHEEVGSRLTMVSTEDIILERPRPPDIHLRKIVLSKCQLNKGPLLMVCRTCGKKRDHWTSRCPYKDLAAESEDNKQKEVGSTLTMVSTKEIILERPRTPGTKAEEPKVASDSLAQLNKGAIMMVCRTCGKKGDHWTSRCPYKDLASESEDNKQKEVGSRLTMVSTEEIILERLRPSGTKPEEPKVAGDSLAQLNKGVILMVCRTCGKKGDHWTSRCPYKDLASESEDNKKNEVVAG